MNDGDAAVRAGKNGTTCPVCNGDGWVRGKDGYPSTCQCVMDRQLKEQYGALISLLKGSVKGKPEGEFRDESQALVKNDRNIAALFYYAANTWGLYPNYRMLTIEELNAIGMGKAAAVRSLYDLVEGATRFVIDWSDQSTFREAGWVKHDERIFFEFMRAVMNRPEKRLVLLIGPQREFKAAHRELAVELGRLELPIYDGGRYWRFASAERERTAESPEEPETGINGEKPEAPGRELGLDSPM